MSKNMYDVSRVWYDWCGPVSMVSGFWGTVCQIDVTILSMSSYFITEIVLEVTHLLTSRYMSDNIASKQQVCDWN